MTEPTTQLVVGDLVRFEAFDPPAVPARVVPRDEIALEAEWGWFEAYFREMYHYPVAGDGSYRQGWRGAWDVALKDLAERRRRVPRHGRHCPCSACAPADWTDNPGPCEMHGPTCPAVYAPIIAAQASGR